MTNYAHWRDKPHKQVHKFGVNPSVSAGAAEDVWDGSVPYTFPSAAATTIVYSDSVADADANASGAHAVVLEGLDASWNEITEEVRLNGTTTVTAVASFQRLHRMYVTSCGADVDTNAGLISAEINDVLAAQIQSDYGQTMMAIYTTPDLDPRDKVYFLGWSCYLPTTTGANAADLRLQARDVNGAWQTKDRAALAESQRFFAVQYSEPVEFTGKTDFRVRIDSVSANSTVVGANFDLVFTTKFSGR